ncbi:TetR/AcrR family transcriptional regulator [Planotetraspora kaengkrachanensis]|uniref:TetR family transcriptional regulator n=1 Tax=Planotetraspora kaengkrachanensis TaxID=575193 RepID=A0A8J3PZT5_9ACTN|nr:TetR/AcrR family transcriptional regulator [Planotetraspora kaengkrachanensis]GIG83883.1 TetR family transcriptional regulator [Planotetraspora kaengkrachanensis]
MDQGAARDQVLDAAEELFYGRGIQAVGMDDIRSLSGVSLKRLYQLFATKDRLVEAYLERRDLSWRRRLAEHVETCADPEGRIIAVFDWLERWFAEPGFRGCAWINSFGELGATSATVATQARLHKLAFRRYLEGLTADAGLSRELAGQLLLLAEGAMVTAGILGVTGTAAQARAAARLLLESAARARPTSPAE